MTSREELEDLQATLTLCGRLICREPDGDEIAALAAAGVFCPAPLEAGREVRAGLALMGGWCQSAGVPVPPERLSTLRREWLELFVGLGKPKAPVWESYYTDPDRRMFGESTLKVRAAYREFGLRTACRGSEPDDNLGAMLGFLAHLVGLEVAAEDGRGSRWDADGLRSAQKSFLSCHVLPWVGAWRAAVHGARPSSFYRGLAEVTFGAVSRHAARFGIRYAEGEARFVGTSAHGLDAAKGAMGTA